MKIRLNKPIGNNSKDAVVDVPDARAAYWIKIGVARHYRPASKVAGSVGPERIEPLKSVEPVTDEQIEGMVKKQKEKAVKKSASEKVQINKPPSKKRIKKPGS